LPLNPLLKLAKKMYASAWVTDDGALISKLVYGVSNCILCQNIIGVISFCRFFDDLRPYALVQFLPCIAIPLMAILLPPMYTHSTYWLWAAGLWF
jgi:hypothetical protein